MCGLAGDGRVRRITPFICFLLLVFLTTSCVTRPPKVSERNYREIPAGYLQPCELPQAPLNNGELSEAYVVAYKCAEQGNRDKQRIRDLTEVERP